MYTQRARNIVSVLCAYNSKYNSRNNKPLLAENPYDVFYEDIPATRKSGSVISDYSRSSLMLPRFCYCHNDSNGGVQSIVWHHRARTWRQGNVIPRHEWICVPSTLMLNNQTARLAYLYDKRTRRPNGSYRHIEVLL